MALRDYLEPHERIQARCDPFYSTSLRLVRYQLTKEGEKVHCVPYSRVRSIELVRKPQHKFMVLGTVLAAGGAFMFFYLAFITSVPTFLMGIGLIIYGGQGKDAYYQLNLADTSPQESELWRIQIRGSKDLIASIGDITGKPLIET